MKIRSIVKGMLSFCVLFLLFNNCMGETDEVIVLTEKRAIEIALKNNYDILSKKKDIKAASAQVKQAWSQVFPHISVGANYTRYHDHPFIMYKSNRGYNFSINQILFSGGRILNNIIASKKALRAVKEDKKELENKIIYSVKEAFYTVLLAKEFVKIRKETLKLAEENLAITKKRYEKGEASYYDLLRSKVEVANIKPQLVKAQNFLETSLNLLKLLLGIPPSKKIEIKGVFKFTNDEKVDLTQKIEFALKHRPILKEISLQKEAADAQVKSAFAGYLPQVNLNFTDYANQKEAFSIGRDKYNDYWVLGITVNIPLFDGFLTHAEVKEAKARRQKIEILKKKLEDSVKVEVKNAVLDLEAAEINVKSQKENVKRAKEAYRIVKERYAQGQASQLDLLDARVALLTARVNLAQSLYDFIVAKAKLKYVVGERK